MSLDPDPVDRLLDRHGERWRSTFVPPQLDGVLAAAIDSRPHRTRWLWPVAAAIALLAIPLLTVVGISDSHRSAARPPGYLGDLDWTGAVLETDPTVLTVAVDVNKTPNYCLANGLPQVRTVVSETAGKVTILAQAFLPSHPSPTPSVPPGATLVCPLRGHAPVPVTVQLKRPLGTRSLIDAKTGIRHRVLAASTVLTPSWLPAGYVDRTIWWWGDDPQGPMMYEYNGTGGLLQVARGHEFPSSDETVLAAATVLGHPARVLTYDAAPNKICVIWNDSEFWWSICSEGVDPKRASLGAEELLRIVNSMH